MIDTPPMTAADVPAELVEKFEIAAVSGSACHVGTGGTADQMEGQEEAFYRSGIAAIWPEIKTIVLADEYDIPTPDGCMCRVHTGEVTVDWQALTAVPDELVDTFEDASLEAVHASNSKTPYHDSDAHIRGGLAAVLTAHEAMIRAKIAEQITEESMHSAWDPGGMARAAQIVRGDQ